MIDMLQVRSLFVAQFNVRDFKVTDVNQALVNEGYLDELKTSKYIGPGSKGNHIFECTYDCPDLGPDSVCRVLVWLGESGQFRADYVQQ